MLDSSPVARRTRSRHASAAKRNVKYRPVQSRYFSHVRHLTSEQDLAFATLDWETVSDDPVYQHFHSMFTRFYDPETCELLDGDAIHPFALASKMHNEDFPTFREILRLSEEEKQKWMESMDEELKALYKFKTFEFVDRSEATDQGEDIIKCTWAFRKKRKPSGEVYRYKSRLCVRGDLQEGVFDSNETYAPVAEWSTIRMLFSLSVLDGWTSASIDFKNAFVQAELPKPIYLELPPGYAQANPSQKNQILRVEKSLYGDRRAANLWYRKLRSTLESKEFEFEVSTFDSCLFIRKDCIVVLYVDDAIIFTKDRAGVERLFSQLRQHDYDFSEDGSFSSYLGIQLNHRPDGSVQMCQPGLKKSAISVMGLDDAHPVSTPITAPLFRHSDSPPFDESFSFRSALGMLQYIGNNSHPECAYAINACARYCVAPRKAHATAIKRIGRYLKGCIDDGLVFSPDGPLSIDCHVDADFAGNYDKSDDDPSSVRSRTGFVITLGSVPVLWRSKVQTEIALSTMEAEYIALSTAMRSLIHLRGLLFGIDKTFKLSITSRLSTISTVFEDNQACAILATTKPPRLTPRSKSLAIKYHWFRQHLHPDSIVLDMVESEKQKGDGFTKPLSHDRFVAFRRTVCGW